MKNMTELPWRAFALKQIVKGILNYEDQIVISGNNVKQYVKAAAFKNRPMGYIIEKAEDAMAGVPLNEDEGFVINE